MHFLRLFCGIFFWCLGISYLGGAQPGYKQEMRAVQNLTVPDAAIVPGVVMLKLAGKPSADFTLALQSNGHWQTGNKALNATLQSIGATHPTSLYASVFDQAMSNELGDSYAKMEAAGLMRWYSIQIPAGGKVQEACRRLQAIAGVEIAEPVGKILLNQVPNDPQFTNQWSLQNTGQFGGSPGADISAVPAWDIETGKPETIVSIHDGGVQLDHPDLQKNLWLAKCFNFVNNSSNLTYDVHGTHVAGLLGAVRNNNTGIAGVAGGDGTVSSGATMLSLQIIGGTPVTPGHEAQSFVYAANNGVAISQNSWSYGSPNFFPQYMAEAIDYFITNGGGTVLKGGMVIFSAGNYNTEQLYYPAAYDKVFAVAATNQFDIKANYSNYGSWVEISAPGGESVQPMVSTITGSGYGNLFGTSMACPLVSGAAALLVSHLPGRLLSDDVRSLLLYGVDDIYPKNIAVYSGKLGSGRLNIFKALKRADSILSAPPMPAVTAFTASAACSTVNLSWQIPPPATHVVIAMAPEGSPIGLPFGQTYQTGDSLPYGGVVVYAGSSSAVQLPMPIDGSSWQYRIWSTNATGTSYSVGTNLVWSIPQTVVQMSSTGTANSISLSWNRQCPQRSVLLAYSTNGRFGIPAGNPALVNNILGGGIALQTGNQTGFLHSNLLADADYYYAWYPYFFNGSTWVYGEPQLLAAHTICSQQILPIEESFTDNNFPPPGWKLTDGGPGGSLQADGRTWRRLQMVGSRPGDDISILINAYTQNGENSKEVLRMPAFQMPSGMDSVVVSFDYTYRAYSDDSELADSLELAWTDDCGSTYHSIWKKGGTELSTVPGFFTAEFIPTGPQDWGRMRIHLNPILPANQMVALALIGTNKFGQNLWVDNVKVQAYEPKLADAVLMPALPLSDTILCQSSFTPKVTVRNQGADTLQSLKIAWQINGVLADSILFSHLSMAPNADTVLALKELAIPAGSAGYTFFTLQPNGVADANPVNDTIRFNISLPGTATIPLKEGFESTAIQPAGWVNQHYFNYWQSTGTAAFSGLQSIMADRFADQTLQGKYDLLTPVLPASPLVDSAFIEFSLAAALKYAGGVVSSDTLEVWISNNCNQSGKLVYSAAGAALATLASPLADPYIPASQAEWRRVKIDITTYRAFFSQNFQGLFRIKKGRGNNIYLDDVQVYTKTIPAALKKAEYGVYPNPFDSYFTIWHLYPPHQLLAGRLINARGQVVRQWTWNGMAPQTIQINASALAKGMYTLELQYQGFVRRQKLLKQ